MPRQLSTQVLRNSARGGQSYKASRHKLSAHILRNPEAELDLSSRFLTKRLFELDRKDWIVLGFDKRDWITLDALTSARSQVIDRHYERLLGEYVLINAERVQRMYAASSAISTAVLNDNGDAIAQALDALDEADSQSLFSFRVFAAQRSHSNELLVSYFRRKMSTDWLRKRFLYPFVYYAINNTSDLFLDEFLSYVISGGIKNQSERDTIKFLLCDEIANDLPPSFRYYIALLCHPYDACEFLLNALEIEYVRHGTLPDHSLTLLQRLADQLAIPRVQSLSALVQKQPLEFVTRPDGSRLRDLFTLDTAQQQFLENLVDVSLDQRPSSEPASRPLLELSRMRASRYPTTEGFTYVVHNAFKWRFVDAGRLLNGLLTSLYLVSRRERDYEARMILRLAQFYGQLFPFLLSSPSAAWILDHDLLPLASGVTAVELEESTGQCMGAPESYQSRLWIKATHWQLRPFERDRRIRAWLETVRRDIRIAPAFLTGINWAWMEDIIRTVRLAPFRGNAAGSYALLLMQIETRNRDSTVLRSAIEPFVKSRNFDQFVGWLVEEFRDEAVAFVHYLLTVENILLLQLAPNYTAALSMRVRALENCVRQFNFGLLLDEQRYLQETKALTAALFLTSIVTGQFEIPWDSFRSDMLEKEADSFQAYLSLTGTANSIPLLGKAKLATPHRFRNGKIVEYDFENNLWPLVVVILALIDGFIEHPSFGIEILLSTRFRHDTMLREYERVIMDAREASISGVPFSVQHPVTDEFAADIFSTVEEWLSRRMQTSRPGRPDALFDCTPTQDELRSIVEHCLGYDSLDGTVSYVCEWLLERLREQVSHARTRFEEELGEALEVRISKKRDILEVHSVYRQTDIAKIASLLSTVVKRLTHSLCDWYRVQDTKNRPSLTFKEVKIAADGVFETQVLNGLLVTRLEDCPQAMIEIEPDRVRLCFDLLTEVFANTLKYGRPGRAKVRIWWLDGPDRGFVCSTPIVSPEAFNRTVQGRRYLSLNDTIFREGNSGLSKIAALAASLAGEDVELQVVQRKKMFHLIIPLWKRNDGQ